MKPKPRPPLTARPSYAQEFGTSIGIERLNLEVARVRQQCMLDDHTLISMDVQEWREEAMRSMVLAIIASVASKKYEFKAVRFPSDWWQALKHRFFPLWLQKKFPVQWDEYKAEACAYYPTIEIPDKAAFVSVVMRKVHERAYL